MSLRSVPLRLKLVAALVIPMLVVAGYLGVNISGSMEQRDIATLQQDEVGRFAEVAAFADAIATENLVALDRNATDDDLAAARAETDATMNLLRSTDLAIAPEVLTAIESDYAQLVALRETIGDRPTEIRLRAQTELRGGELTLTGEYLPALAAASDLPSSVLAKFEFDAASIADVRTAELIDDYRLIQRYRADFSGEVATMLRVTSLPANLVTGQITEIVGTSIAESDQSLQTLIDLGTPALAASIMPVVDGAAHGEYVDLRTIVDDAAPGVKPDVDTATIQASASRVDAALDSVANGVIGELDRQSVTSLSSANRDLVISALIGLWLLVIVGLVLRVLYRAIKAPIENLTIQSQQIAAVELPEVVAKMRRGEIHDIPEIEEIESESNDEIGALVDAFNEMHRTAVELAAEQAASRRVVADMFVNLGRRNQRLVNRLLKGLTVLEQHEEDPDKLASLYEIDHVATRMRRNAESLLVLAGAGQSRRWDKPVGMYDIARASLAEVENYERVQIDAGDDISIDGGVVADLTHLLAELVENALSFSPPTSPVEIVARTTDRGLLIAVSDHGVGMPAEQLADANRQISVAAEEEETPSEFLGHYVVGRLAARHGFAVELLEGPAGGLTARVHLPATVAGHASIPVADDTPIHDPRPVLESTSLDPAVAAFDAHVAAQLGSPLELGSTSASQESSAVPASAAPQPPATLAPTPVADSLGEQTRRVRGNAITPNEQVAVPVEQPTPTAAPTPVASAVPTPTAAPTPVASAVPTPVASAVPTPVRSAVPTPVAAAAPTPAPAPPNPSTFDWPTPLEIDPLMSSHREAAAELAPRPSTPTAPSVGRSSTPGTAPVVGTAPADTAMASPANSTAQPPPTLRPSNDSTAILNEAADQAVAGALNAFGAPRRTPGANLPPTDLLASISGSMGTPAGQSGGRSPGLAPAAVHTPTHDDADAVRSALSGFQSGTSRADRENGDISS